MTAAARAALFATGQGLMPCARHARRLGWRVVTMAQDEPEHVFDVLAGPRLADLVRRMAEGEFEAIVADPGAGRLLILQLAQPIQGVLQ